MTTIMKQAYTPKYDFSIRERVKRYFAKHPRATTYACATALHLQWHTVKRYRTRLGV